MRLALALLAALAAAPAQAQLAARWAPVLAPSLPLIAGGPAAGSAAALSKLDLSSEFGLQALEPLAARLHAQGFRPEIFQSQLGQVQAVRIRGALELEAQAFDKKAKAMLDEYHSGAMTPKRTVAAFDEFERLLIYGHPYLSEQRRASMGNVHGSFQQKAAHFHLVLLAKAQAKAEALRPKVSGVVEAEGQPEPDAELGRMFGIVSAAAKRYLEADRSLDRETWRHELAGWADAEKLAADAANGDRRAAAELRRVLAPLLATYRSFLKKDPHMDEMRKELRLRTAQRLLDGLVGGPSQAGAWSEGYEAAGPSASRPPAEKKQPDPLAAVRQTVKIMADDMLQFLYEDLSRTNKERQDSAERFEGLLEELDGFRTLGPAEKGEFIKRLGKAADEYRAYLGGGALPPEVRKNREAALSVMFVLLANPFL